MSFCSSETWLGPGSGCNTQVFPGFRSPSHSETAGACGWFPGMLSLQPSLDHLSPAVGLGALPLQQELWVSARDSSGCKGDGHLRAAVLGLGALPSFAVSLGAGTGN